MTLSEFKSFIRLYVPGAKIAVINDSTLEMLINHAVRQVNLLTMAYQADTYISVVADQAEYDIKTYISNFVLMDRSGIWWNSGTAASPDWQKLDSVSRDYCDSQYPTWRDDVAGDPIRYFTDGDKITFHPKPDTSLANGFRVYYIRDTVDMVNSSDYPFSGSTEVPRLRVLDEAIIDYVRSKLMLPLGKDAQGIVTEEVFLKTLQRQTMLLNRRPDIMSNPEMRMRGPNIG